MIKDEKQAGHYQIRWDAKNEYGIPVITGQYFIRLIVKQKKEVDTMIINDIVYQKVIKMILLK